jgi:hypothetical protein
MPPRVVALEDEKVYLSSEELDTTAPSLVRQAELERGLGGFACRSADQSLNCLALIADIESVKELFPIKVEHKQTYSRR